jgi:broad specificity phosphatase PhoE
MENTIIFLRHAKVKKELGSPSEKWVLSEEGIKIIENIVATGIFDDVEVIISSAQKMCIQTSYFLADRLGKEIITNSDLDEIGKGTIFIEHPEDYKQQVKEVFENPNESINEWEPANSALKRFQRGMEKIYRDYSHRKILIVSHGIVMNLYFNYLLKESQDKLLTRYLALKSCAWGRVVGTKVERDFI